MIIDTENLENYVVTTELVEAYENLKDRIDNKIDQVFYDYCEIKKIAHAYGVRKWQWCHKTVLIVQDTSCMGCYNEEKHSLPLEWFLVPRDDSKKLIEADTKQKNEEAKALNLKHKKQKLAELEKKASELRSELGNL